MRNEESQFDTRGNEGGGGDAVGALRGSSSALRAKLRRAAAAACALSLLAAPVGATADEYRGDRRGGGESRDGGRRDGDRGDWSRGGDRHDRGRSDVRGGGGDRDRWRHEPQRGEWYRRDNRWEWRRDEYRGGDRHSGPRGRWHFEPRYGWRYQPRVGVWSPFYVWWWLDGRTVLGVAPTATILRYRTGYYTLRGDGIVEPYVWVWVPTLRAPPPPPPVPPELAPDAVLVEPWAEPRGGREAAGTIIGGAVGGVLGSTVGHGAGRVGGIVIGTLLGAILGHDIGKTLDEADELHAARVLEKNRTGQGSTWVNPDTGAQVTVVPERTYETAAGEPCREYQTEVTVGGQKQQAYGKACRQPDGQWKIVE